MTDPIDPATLSDPRDLAAYWFTRLHSGTMTDRERQDFAAWRHAHPDNERQYRYVHALWTAAGRLPAHQLRTLGYPARDRAAPDTPMTRRHFAYGLGAACGAGILVAAIGPAGWRDPPDYDAAFATDRGERRREQLPDGTQLDVNTGTTVRIRFYRDRRSVALVSGEILCRVESDRTRPFVVDVDTGTVRAVGTCFNVRQEPDALQVAVAHGEVELRIGPWWRPNTARLLAGWEGRVGQDGIPVARGGVDVAAQIAWRDGQIVFNSTSLSDAMSELNRYLAQPVLLPDPRVRDLRISGIFRIDDPQALLSALPRILPVQVLARTGGGTDVVAR